MFEFQKMVLIDQINELKINLQNDINDILDLYDEDDDTDNDFIQKGKRLIFLFDSVIDKINKTKDIEELKSLEADKELCEIYSICKSLDKGE